MLKAFSEAKRRGKEKQKNQLKHLAHKNSEILRVFNSHATRKDILCYFSWKTTNEKKWLPIEQTVNYKVLRTKNLLRRKEKERDYSSKEHSYNSIVEINQHHPSSSCKLKLKRYI